MTTLLLSGSGYLILLQ